MTTPHPTISTIGHDIGSLGSLKRSIDRAIVERDLGRSRAEHWTLCAWDGCFRRADQITAIIPV